MIIITLAVYFEQKEYEKCIEEAKEAVEIGRENQANYLLIAKFVYSNFFISSINLIWFNYYT